jgi:light-harvesting protein B-800-850 alpha chain
MNQGRIWCVVNPTVGLPLFLGSVAITSLIVHASILTHTTWMGGYWQGKAAKVAMVDPAADHAKLAATAPAAKAVVVASNDQK